ncbi:hypothetical protein VTK56DRAFT_9513 [Thermocarpiscus australiensis]
MDRSTQSLTLKLLIFEDNDDEKTLTADVAERFARLFSPEDARRAAIRRVYEVAKVAIETLCHEFCHRNGRLSLRRVNPNPNLVFTVGVDPNSPTDDMFLRSFVKCTARHTVAFPGPGRGSHAALSTWRDHLVAVARPWLAEEVMAVRSHSGQEAPAALVAAAGAAAVHYLDGEAGDAKHMALAQQASAAANQAMSSLAELEPMSEKLDDTEEAIHRDLYLTVLDVLRSDYRRGPNAARLAKLAMDMAAALKPAALENWDEERSSHQALRQELKEMAEAWAKPAGRGL